VNLHKLAILLFLLPGCDKLPLDQVPFIKGCVKSSRYKRVSEPSDVDCEAKKGRRPKDGCVTKKIACGDEIKGNTTGGKANFDDEIYRSSFCIPFTHDYTGKERIYHFELPAQSKANIWLDSDCADLDLFAMQWNYDGKCPTPSHRISVCEGDDEKGGGMVHLEAIRNPLQYLVVVDGKAGVTAPFHLTVECESR